MKLLTFHVLTMLFIFIGNEFALGDPGDPEPNLFCDCALYTGSNGYPKVNICGAETTCPGTSTLNDDGLTYCCTDDTNPQVPINHNLSWLLAFGSIIIGFYYLKEKHSKKGK